MCGLLCRLKIIENMIASSLEGVERRTSCQPVWSSFFIQVYLETEEGNDRNNWNPDSGFENNGRINVRAVGRVPL